MLKLADKPAKKDHIVDLRFCTVLFVDNAHYPGVYLVPKKENIKNMTDLTMEERLQLMREIALCEECLSENFSCDQTDVGIVSVNAPQFHVHILCRKKNDKNWPDAVLGNKEKPYTKDKKQEMICRISKAINIKISDGKYMQF